MPSDRAVQKRYKLFIHLLVTETKPNSIDEGSAEGLSTVANAARCVQRVRLKPAIFSEALWKLTMLQVLGSLAFAGMTVVNLTVFVLVAVGIFRRTRIHH